jgi:SUR7/PalI family
MNYCEGYYEPNTTVTREEHPSENVTYCSNRTALFHFDPTAIIESELAPGVNLTTLHWPSEIEDAIRAVEVASKAMFIFYCIGIGFAGFALIGAAWGVLANGRISASVNFMLDMVSSLNPKAARKMTRCTLPAMGYVLEDRVGSLAFCFLIFTGR